MSSEPKSKVKFCKREKKNEEHCYRTDVHLCTYYFTKDKIFSQFDITDFLWHSWQTAAQSMHAVLYHTHHLAPSLLKNSLLYNSECFCNFLKFMTKRSSFRLDLLLNFLSQQKWHNLHVRSKNPVYTPVINKRRVKWRCSKSIIWFRSNIESICL